MSLFFRRGAAALFGLISLPLASFATAGETVDLWLTVLHHNDGESELLPREIDGAEYGGISRFANLVRRLQWRAEVPTPGMALQGGALGSVLVSSGDNFLAGPEFNASLARGLPYYDSIGLGLIGYDAIAIGNHEFDFGPEVLARFITGVLPQPAPFLSANLDVTPELGLHLLSHFDRIAASTVIDVEGRPVGIIGATTPELAFISNPGEVGIEAVVPAVQAEIDALLAQGVSRIILISHLQSVQQDLALIPALSGVDIVVAGGGDELLANLGERNSLLLPGTTAEDVFGPYPLQASDADGRSIPVVTTSGQYLYLGRLVAGFDAAGEIVALEERLSGPVRIGEETVFGGVRPNALIERLVVEPVAASIAALGENVIGTSEVALNGVRGDIRTQETNEGNLVADAILWQARALAPAAGVAAPDLALANGGGIRNDTLIAAGELTELTTFDILPFANFVVTVPGVPRATLKLLLENAVSRVEEVSGRFAQVAGVKFTWDAAQPAGSRVLEAMLADGAPLISGGVVVPGAPVNIATINFLANGGDQYPFDGAPFVSLGPTYQQALASYIAEELGGMVRAVAYPLGGEGRITRLN